LARRLGPKSSVKLFSMNDLLYLAGFLHTQLDMMPPVAPDSLAGRFLEPLSHPWTAVTGGLLSAGVVSEDVPIVALRIAWRLLRLLLAL